MYIMFLIKYVIPPLLTRGGGGILTIISYTLLWDFL